MSAKDRAAAVRGQLAGRLELQEPLYDRSKEHFDALTWPEKQAAIRELAAQGHGASTIATACSLSIAAVRQILGRPGDANP